MSTLSLEKLDGSPVYGPADGESLPGVVLLHGSEGPLAGWSHRFAAILAAHGLMVLPWAFGVGNVWAAGPIKDVDISGIPHAGRVLESHPRVGRVGLFGWSKGGEAAMHVAALSEQGAPFHCIAAHAAADNCTNAFDPQVYLKGGPALEMDPAGPRAWMWPGQDEALTPGRAIEVERWAGPMLLSVGDADDVWDPGMTLRLAKRRQEAGLRTDLFVAKGQGHTFSFDREPELWARLVTFFTLHLRPTG